MTVIGNINNSGNILSGNANLTFQKSAGTIFSPGGNWDVDVKDPHVKALDVIDTSGVNPQDVFQYTMYDGTQSAPTSTLTDIIPNLLDDGSPYPGTTYANNRWGVNYVYSFLTNNLRIGPPQAEFLTEEAAIESINDGNRIVFAPFSNGMLIGYIITKGNCTDLTDTATSHFLSAGKFGSSVSQVVGGTQNLQSVYDNSAAATIVTDTTRLALKLQNNGTTDAENVLEGRNKAGTLTFAVSGAGALATNSTVNGMLMSSTGTGNCLLGHDALSLGDFTGVQNTVLGDLAANELLGGYQNVMVGGVAGQKTTTGNQNVFLGFDSGSTSHADATRNCLIGRGTNVGATGTLVTDSVVIGSSASTQIDRQCVIGTPVGVQSIQSIVPGVDAVCDLGTVALSFKDVHATGVLSGTSLQADSWLPTTSTVKIGSSAGQVISGGDNIAIGNDTLKGVGTGAGNIAIGTTACTNVTNGAGNVGIGQSALSAQTTGGSNIGIGRFAFLANVSASNGVAIGSNALDKCTASNNTGIGHQAGNTIVGGTNNTMIGNDSDGIAAGTNQTALGNGAVCTASHQLRLGNTAVTEVVPGHATACDLGSTASQWKDLRFTGSLLPDGNVKIGTGAGALMTGVSNIAIGDLSMDAAGTGTSNVAIGVNCMSSLTNGSANIAFGQNCLTTLTTGSTNTAMGRNCLNVCTGGANVGIGESSLIVTSTGNSNTAIGTGAGSLLTSGSNNTMLGTGTNGLVSGTNQTSVGNGAVCDASNQITVGDGSVTEFRSGNDGGCDLGASSSLWGNLYMSGFILPSGQTKTTTIGAAGAASALPTLPLSYWTVDIGGTSYKIPLYNT
jgi:hypothetical protein